MLATMQLMSAHQDSIHVQPTSSERGGRQPVNECEREPKLFTTVTNTQKTR